MGPHVFACGNEDVTDWFNSRGTASMGPHVFACGNLAHEAILDVAAALQWGRTFLRAEISSAPNCDSDFRMASMGPHVFACGNRQCPACLAHIGAGASMGPHVFACGNSSSVSVSRPIPPASMGPHVFACGNDEQRESATKAGLASMGPHVFACGNVLGTAVCGRAIPGFNGAARFCVRKCNAGRGRGRT